MYVYMCISYGICSILVMIEKKDSLPLPSWWWCCHSIGQSYKIVFLYRRGAVITFCKCPACGNGCTKSKGLDATLKALVTLRSSAS